MSAEPVNKLPSWAGRFARSRSYFIVFKLPTLLITAILGFIFEFMMELPFMALCIIDSRLKKRKVDSRFQRNRP
jgi:hypothetical protein